MCCEDIRIGKHTRSAISVVPVGVGNTPLIGPSPNRNTLIISPPDAGTLFFGPQQSLPAGRGFQCNGNNGIQRFTLKDDGDVVREAWYGSVPAGASAVLIIEGVLDGFCDDSTGVQSPGH